MLIETCARVVICTCQGKNVDVAVAPQRSTCVERGQPRSLHPFYQDKGKPNAPTSSLQLNMPIICIAGRHIRFPHVCKHESKTTSHSGIHLVIIVMRSQAHLDVASNLSSDTHSFLNTHTRTHTHTHTGRTSSREQQEASQQPSRTCRPRQHRRPQREIYISTRISSGTRSPTAS
jgi:hypothetical protein